MLKPQKFKCIICDKEIELYNDDEPSCQYCTDTMGYTVYMLPIFTPKQNSQRARAMTERVL